MRIYSVSNADYLSKSVKQSSLSQSRKQSSGLVFEGSHICRNTGIGVGTAVSLVGFGLWNLATGGVPLLIGALCAGGTAAAAAFGDALDKIAEEDEQKNKKP